MLAFENLKLKQDHRTVFRGLSGAFKAGEFWAIIGQNGVGKSTLLSTLAGMQADWCGKISVDGQPISALKPRDRAQKISYLLQEQEPCLAFSVREAVSMGRYPWPAEKQKDQKEIAEALITCGINNLQDRSILKLSGGERRKVEIATCLAQQADYFLLDEPLNHLDLVYRQHILRVFKALSQARGVVMVCHDLDAVKNHCTHVLMLLENDCYLAGTSATILNKENLKLLFNDHSKLD